jgi:hypothetical protein
MRQTIMVVLMIVAFVSGMGLRGWWESEALAKSCLTPDWCEDYNTCTQLGCQPIGTVDGCIAEDCVVCCEFTRTKYDCNGDGAQIATIIIFCLWAVVMSNVSHRHNYAMWFHVLSLFPVLVKLMHMHLKCYSLPYPY